MYICEEGNKTIPTLGSQRYLWRDTENERLFWPALSRSRTKEILVQMYNVLANAATNILQSSVNIRGSDYVAVPLLQYNTNTKEMQIEIQCKYLHCTHKRSRFTPPGNIPAGGIGWEATLYSSMTLGRTVQIQNCAGRDLQLHIFVCGNISWTGRVLKEEYEVKTLVHSNEYIHWCCVSPWNLLWYCWVSLWDNKNSIQNIVDSEQKLIVPCILMSILKYCAPKNIQNKVHQSPRSAHMRLYRRFDSSWPASIASLGKMCGEINLADVTSQVYLRHISSWFF